MAECTITFTFKQRALRIPKMITSELDRLQGEDAKALKAREFLPEPCQFDGFIVHVFTPRKVSYSVFPEDPVKLPERISFNKRRVIIGASSFFAWEYQGKIYL